MLSIALLSTFRIEPQLNATKIVKRLSGMMNRFGRRLHESDPVPDDPCNDIDTVAACAVIRLERRSLQ